MHMAVLSLRHCRHHASDMLVIKCSVDPCQGMELLVGLYILAIEVTATMIVAVDDCIFIIKHLMVTSHNVVELLV